MGNLGVSAASVPSRLELRGPRALCGEQCGRPTQCSRKAFANVLGCKNVSSTFSFTTSCAAGVFTVAKCQNPVFRVF